MSQSGAPCQLFDLSVDPNELENVAGTYPEKVSELAADLQAVYSPSLENDRAERFINQQIEYIRQAAEQNSRVDA